MKNVVITSKEVFSSLATATSLLDRVEHIFIRSVKNPMKSSPCDIKCHSPFSSADLGSCYGASTLITKHLIWLLSLQSTVALLSRPSLITEFLLYLFIYLFDQMYRSTQYTVIILLSFCVSSESPPHWEP